MCEVPAVTNKEETAKPRPLGDVQRKGPARLLGAPLPAAAFPFSFASPKAFGFSHTDAYNAG